MFEATRFIREGLVSAGSHAAFSSTWQVWGLLLGALAIVVIIAVVVLWFTAEEYSKRKKQGKPH